MYKEDLKEFITHRKELIQKQEILSELRSKLSIVSPILSDDIKAQGPVKSKVCEQVTRIVDLENEIAASVEKTYDKMLQIEKAIEKLDGVERVIMRERYIFDKQWERIANEQGFSWRQTHRYHSSALQKMKDDTQ